MLNRETNMFVLKLKNKQILWPRTEAHQLQQIN